MSIEYKLLPDTLLLLKAFDLAEKEPHFYTAKEHYQELAGDDIHMLSDHEVVGDSLREGIDGLMNGRVRFDNSRGLSAFMSFPVSLDFLNFCILNNIPTKLSIWRFLWSADRVSVIRRIIDDDTSEKRKQENHALFDRLLEQKDEHKKELISVEELRKLIAQISYSLRKLSGKYDKEQEQWVFYQMHFDEKGLDTAVDTLEMINKGQQDRSKDFNFFHLARTFIVEAIHQQPEFFSGIRLAVDSYLDSIINADLIFDDLSPWNKQLHLVRSELEHSSMGKSEFTVDYMNFSRKLSSIYSGIPPNLRPVECLFLLERMGEIVIKSLEKDENDDHDEFIRLRVAFKVRGIEPSSKKSSTRRTATVNGISIDFEIQKVSHPEYGSFIFKSGRTPWKIVRICAEEKPDGLGKASLETLGITQSDIFKKLKLVNMQFSKEIVHYKDGYVYLDPNFKE